jgi:hypothetical protein
VLPLRFQDDSGLEAQGGGDPGGQDARGKEDLDHSLRTGAWFHDWRDLLPSGPLFFYILMEYALVNCHDQPKLGLTVKYSIWQILPEMAFFKIKSSL